MSTIQRYGLVGLLICLILISLYLAFTPKISYFPPPIPTNFLGLWRTEDRSDPPLGNCFSFSEKEGFYLYRGDTISENNWKYIFTIQSPTSIQMVERHSPYTTYQLTLDKSTQILVQWGESQAIYTRYTGDLLTCFDPQA
jgi:hypothetical protein